MCPRILIADDEPDILGMLGGNLHAAGFDVIEALNGHDALTAAREFLPAAAVLDCVMPGMTGLEICRELRSDPQTLGIPVMMLTGRHTELDRVLAFELGVDDYVTKPFSPREIVLRLRAILRRGLLPAAEPGKLEAGRIAIDLGRHQVTVAGEPVELTAIEFKLLATLVRKVEHVLSRETLLAAVWRGAYDVDPRTIDTHFRRMRDKLGEAARQIATVRGFGYRLTAG